MFVIIKSKNPKLSFIINKNPNTGMKVKSLRKGTIFNWYDEEGSNITYFKDAIDGVSYGYQEFEYLDKTRYVSSATVLGIMTNFFGSTFKSQHEDDVDGYENIISIPLLRITNKKIINRIIKYFPDVHFDMEWKIEKVYEVTIKTNHSLFYTMNIVNILMLLITLRSVDYVHKKKDSTQKYLKMINLTNSPFYIRSIFSQYMLNSKTNFEENIKDLNLPGMEIAFGNTQSQRFDAIKDSLEFDKPILDIGCGDGYYSVPFSKLAPHVYSVDIDRKPLTNLENKIRNRNIKNISIFDCVEAFDKNDLGVDVLLTEVIEHMPLKDAENLIKYVLETIDFENFIITTPNKDFNKHYLIEENEFRHNDHDWEMSNRDFQEWVIEIVNNYPDLELEFSQIGDRVDGVGTSTMLKIKHSTFAKRDYPESLDSKAHLEENAYERGFSRLKKMNDTNIRYLSGTMPPASSNLVTNQLESLDNGLNHYFKKGIDSVILQPKYMGSRAQLYLHKNGENNFAVSRKGYKFSDSHIEGLDVFLKTYVSSHKIQNLFETLDVDHFILDGELRPWSAANYKYIDRDFLIYQKGVEKELELLGKYNFVDEMEELISIHDEYSYYYKIMEKQSFIENYGMVVYNICKHSDSLEVFDLEDRKEKLEIYKKQLEIYNYKGVLSYHPFKVLYAEKDGVKHDLSNMNNEDHFKITNDDEYIVITHDDFTNPLNKNRMEMFHNWYHELTDKGTEGVVIKPLDSTLPDDVAPFIKVRNEDYLTIVYGYDYKTPRKYRQLIERKRTGRKVRASRWEYILGERILNSTPGTKEYYEALTSMTETVLKNTHLDPRL